MLTLFTSFASISKLHSLSFSSYAVQSPFDMSAVQQKQSALNSPPPPYCVHVPLISDINDASLPAELMPDQTSQQQGQHRSNTNLSTSQHQILALKGLMSKQWLLLLLSILLPLTKLINLGWSRSVRTNINVDEALFCIIIGSAPLVLYASRSLKPPFLWLFLVTIVCLLTATSLSVTWSSSGLYSRSTFSFPTDPDLANYQSSPNLGPTSIPLAKYTSFHRYCKIIRVVD